MLPLSIPSFAHLFSRAITLDLGEFATIVSADWMFGGNFSGAGAKT